MNSYNEDSWRTSDGEGAGSVLVGFDRADLVLVAILLTFLGAMAVVTVGYDRSVGETAASLSIATVLGLAAAACFRGVVRWGKDEPATQDSVAADRMGPSGRSGLPSMTDAPKDRFRAA